MTRPLSSRESWSIARLAFWYLDRGRTFEAEALARGLITVNRGDGLGWLYYGEARRLQGDAEEAARGYQEAARIFPQRSDIWLRLGTILIELERYQDARHALDSARQHATTAGLNARVDALLFRCR